MNHVFHEVKRKVNPNSFVDSVVLENNYYVVKLYYTGSELRENKPLDKHELLISCKPKKDNLILRSANGEFVTIDDPELMSIRPQDVDDVIRRLRIAEQSALALKEKLSEYLR